MNNKIVITGLGAITPLGNDATSTWDALISGACGVGRISKFDPSDLPVQIAAEVKYFDPEMYMSKKLVRQMEPFAQYAFAAADQAMKDAGIVRSEDEDYPISERRIGITLGNVFGGLSEVESSAEKLAAGAAGRINPRFTTEIIGNIAAAQIAIDKGLTGPSITVSTACSSGIDAITVGAMLIETGQADAVLCVGTEAATCPINIKGLSAMHALSTNNIDPEGASRPFDLGRDGFVMGEGAGAIVLEKKDTAEGRNAHIYAELLGYSNGTDGYHVTSPHPDGIGAIAVMQNAIDMSGLDPADIDYINAHGTSTPKGDSIEVKAIKTVFGDDTRVAVSSTKGSTGHMMGAGGIVETIFCIKAVTDGVIPPTINQKTPDPECDIDTVPNEARRTEVRYAMSNAFGFGGQNGSLIVGEYK